MRLPEAYKKTFTVPVLVTVREHAQGETAANDMLSKEAIPERLLDANECSDVLHSSLDSLREFTKHDAW